MKPISLGWFRKRKGDPFPVGPIQKGTGSFETCDGEIVIVETRSLKSENPPASRSSYSEPAESISAWVREQSDEGRRFVDRHIDDGDLPEVLVPMALDVAFASWLKATEKGRESADAVRDACGALFGDYLAVQLGMRWQVVVDDVGTDLAVCLHIDGRDVQAWPFSMVQKRIDAHEAGFFHNVFLAAKSMIEHG